MNLEFSAEMWFWRGPEPWHYITVPKVECGEAEALELGDMVTVRLTVDV